ncbi:MAG: DUF6446 family protein [Cypionkella sp.]|nr:DUF6446 family protein [Cypionkella sp.]
MKAGKVVAAGFVGIGVVTGASMYWLQQYAFYVPVQFVPSQEILLTPIVSGVAESILVEDIQGIDATSSPLRFRACFTTPLTHAMLTETYMPYPNAVPLNAPSWFDCFNAAEIGEAIKEGQALAFLSQAQIAPQIDRVVAVFPDGRAYAWHQVVPELGTDYSGTPRPAPQPAAPQPAAPQTNRPKYPKGRLIWPTF